MRKVTNYYDFISESTLNLILEANIFYKKDFMDIIQKIESPIKDHLLSLIGKDIDVNQNHIDVLLDKDDTLLFYQDDKLSKITSRVNYGSILFDKTGEIFNYEKDLNFTNFDRNSIIRLREIGSFDAYIERQITKLDPLYKYVSYLIDNEYEIFVVRYNLDGNDVRFIAYNLERSYSTLKPSEMKVGRFIRALLKKGGFDFKDKEIEDFVNKYKSAIKIKRDSFTRFEEVKGEDIRKWYLESNYYQNLGTLGSSCMRYSKCQRFLDIYVKNTKNVSMIILKPEGISDKICGRAILWIDDSGRYIMDRIYTNNHADVRFFIEYANFKNYHHKFNQNYEPLPFVYNGVKLSNDESVSLITLEYSTFGYYPYMDTFKYYSESGTITNDYGSGYDYELTDTNGGNGSCDTCGGSGSVECDCCDGGGSTDCDYCYNGSNTCQNCDGDGEYECSECDGAGDVECSSCDGDGCDDCKNGRLDCVNCGGNGNVNCDECDDGRIECESCDGEGTRECGCCDGSGRQECYECN